jgi:hypothetical protein
MTNEELYEIIIKLSNKVELLENEIIQLKMAKSRNKKYDISTLIPKPNMILSDWIYGLIIKDEHIHSIFTPSCGVVYAFKQCILDNLEISKKNSNKDSYKDSCLKIPFYKHNKNGDLFIYTKNNDICEWVIFDTTHMAILTKDIWLKFLKLYTKIENTLGENEDIRDLQKQKIMNMRIKLYEVDKNRRELMKWFVNIF